MRLFLLSVFGLLVCHFTCLKVLAQGQRPDWQSAKVLEGIGYSDVDANGNTYTLGYFSGTTNIGGTILTSYGYNDGFLAKYSPTGALLWVRQIGSASNDYPSNFVLDGAGNAYVLGENGGSISLGNNVTIPYVGILSNSYIVRFNVQGIADWAQWTPNGSGTFTDICIDRTAHVFLTGMSSSQITLGGVTLPSANGPRPFIARMSTLTGAVEFINACCTYVPFTRSTQYYYPRIAASPSGEIYLLNAFVESVIINGITLPARGNPDVLIAKYTTAGNFEWLQVLGGAGAGVYANAARIDAFGNLYVAGWFGGAVTFGPPTSPVVLNSGGLSDAFLVKLAPTGSVAWAQAGGGSGQDEYQTIALDATNSPTAVGKFSGTARFGSTTLSSLGGQDVAVVTYSSQGQLRWAQQAGGAGLDTGERAGFDSSGVLRVLGHFTTACTFGSIAIASPLATPGYVATLGTSALATQNPNASTLKFYPNPATTTIQLGGVPTGSDLELIDAVGRVVRTALTPVDGRISVVGLLPGVYVLRIIIADSKRYTARVEVL